MPFGRQNRAIAVSKRNTNVSGLTVLLGDDDVGRHEAVSCSAGGTPGRLRMPGMCGMWVVGFKMGFGKRSHPNSGPASEATVEYAARRLPRLCGRECRTGP